VASLWEASLTAHLALKEQVFLANLRIVDAGLVILTFGNCSGVDRAAGVMAIKPSGVPYEELGPESMVIVDLETGLPEGSQKPSSDTPTHLVLYRHFSAVGGIVHTHSPCATSWAQARRVIPCFGTTHADHFHGSVPVTRPLTGDQIHGEYERCTGDVIVEAFERGGLDPSKIPGVLVASHGPFAWGADPDLAVENAVALEAVAAMALHSVALQPELRPVEHDLLDRHYARKHGEAAYYGQDR
jgi:L-ribulose-5-phosphate 4-epimerase